METIRRKIIACLSQGSMSAIDISQSLGISEKDVYEHLPHVARTVSRYGKRLMIHPSRCLQCEFVFKDRKRFTRPSRCPQCRSTRIRKPLYEIC